jgi:hypothetical protein
VENIRYCYFPYHKICDMENIRYVIFPYHKTCYDTSRVCVQAMYIKAGHFMTTRSKRQRENRPTLFDAVGASRFFDMEVSPFCEWCDLASFALTCREALPCVIALLTEQKIWRVSILLKHYKTQWTWTKFPGRMSHVRRVHMDRSINILPGDMGLTSCKEVYFFNPQRKWHAGLRPRQLNVHPPMFPNGVVTLRFDEALTPCLFEGDSEFKFPTSVQTIFCGQSPYNYCVQRFMRALPASVTTCVLTKMRDDLGVGVLPNHLRSLTLDAADVMILDGVLPLALETLFLNGKWTLYPKNVLSRCQAIVKLVLNYTAGGGYVAMSYFAYPPNLETLVLGPETTEGNEPLKIPGSVKKLVFHMKYTNQLAAGALPEGLTHLEFVDVDFVYLYMPMFVFPHTLKYLKISMHAVGLEHATECAVDYFHSLYPDILVEVGVTEYAHVFL